MRDNSSHLTMLMMVITDLTPSVSKSQVKLNIFKALHGRQLWIIVFVKYVKTCKN